MRALLAAVLLLTGALAGCTGPGGNPSLRPPCADSAPVRIEIGTDKEQYLPAEVINATLVLNNSGGQAASYQVRSWELTLRAFDGRMVRAWVHEVDPTLPEGISKVVEPRGRVVLQARWQPFRVSGELIDPLQPGTYYLCAVLVGTDGSTLATGAKPIVAQPPPRTL